MSMNGLINRNKKGGYVSFTSSATSGYIRAENSALIGFQIPASGFSGTSVTFQVCDDVTAGTWLTVRDRNNVDVSLSVSAGKSYLIPIDVTVWPYVRLVSSTSETAPVIRYSKLA